MRFVLSVCRRPTLCPTSCVTVVAKTNSNRLCNAPRICDGNDGRSHFKKLDWHEHGFTGVEIADIERLRDTKNAINVDIRCRTTDHHFGRVRIINRLGVVAAVSISKPNWPAIPCCCKNPFPPRVVPSGLTPFNGCSASARDSPTVENRLLTSAMTRSMNVFSSCGWRLISVNESNSDGIRSVPGKSGVNCAAGNSDDEMVAPSKSKKIFWRVPTGVCSSAGR